MRFLRENLHVIFLCLVVKNIEKNVFFKIIVVHILAWYRFIKNILWTCNASFQVKYNYTIALNTFPSHSNRTPTCHDQRLPDFFVYISYHPLTLRKTPKCLNEKGNTSIANCTTRSKYRIRLRERRKHRIDA